MNESMDNGVCRMGRQGSEVEEERIFVGISYNKIVIFQMLGILLLVGNSSCFLSLCFFLGKRTHVNSAI